ncbi:unnamed protein product [Ilex paraguariensis]|uniref:Uncharacterized protein n=1 Tax=Ilex paraguariensis TaxID=185542 RepID=A0ABC8UGZ7_9AQUA
MARLVHPSSTLAASCLFPSFPVDRLCSKFLHPKSLNLYLNPCITNVKSFSRCKASWQELAGVLIFSAIPFTAVKAIANSSLGDVLQRRMEEKKKFFVENSSKFKALAKKARKDR